MDYTIGAEETQPGRWMGWVFELPGCTTYGRTREEVLARAPEQISAFLAWQDQYGGGFGPLFNSGPIGVYLFETVYYTATDESVGNSRAFFDDDKLPLKSDELDQAFAILTHTRQELMKLVDPIPMPQLAFPIEGEVRGSIANVLEHLAWAEWWYLDRLNLAFNREEMPENPIAKLDQVRAWTKARLREMIGKKVVLEQLGEKWSPRKILRRAIWHELDHIVHIAELLNGQVDPNGRYVEL